MREREERNTATATTTERDSKLLWPLAMAATTPPNPAQHLQWQQHRLSLPLPRPPTTQAGLQASKCRHVQYECSCSCSGSWMWSWRRLAWLLAVVCLLTRPVMPEVIYRVDPLGKCFVLFSLFRISTTETARAKNRDSNRDRERDRVSLGAGYM